MRWNCRFVEQEVDSGKPWMLASTPSLGHSSILSSFSPLLKLKIGFVGECNEPWGK
jgi:hypothetical protein